MQHIKKCQRPEFEKIRVSFLFKKNMVVYLNYIYNEHIVLNFNNVYDIKSRVLTRELGVKDCSVSKSTAYDNCSSDIITNPDEIKKYLDKYKITDEDLELYYSVGMNDIFLKDWFSVYKSRFNPDDLGEYEVIDTWK